MRHADAARLAADVASWLAPGCAEIVVVGSIRRGKAEVKDIELAILPATITDLFGVTRSAPGLLDHQLAPVLGSRWLVRHMERPAWGDRLRRLYCPAEAVTVELWIADSADNWGNVLAIRTGPADFGRLLVTQWSAGGLMPPGMGQRDGYLWRGTERLPCPDEAALFAALGVGSVPEPRERTAALVARLRAQMKRTA